MFVLVRLFDELLYKSRGWHTFTTCFNSSVPFQEKSHSRSQCVERRLFNDQTSNIWEHYHCLYKILVKDMGFLKKTIGCHSIIPSITSHTSPKSISGIEDT